MPDQKLRSELRRKLREKRENRASGSQPVPQQQSPAVAMESMMRQNGVDDERLLQMMSTIGKDPKNVKRLLEDALKPTYDDDESPPPLPGETQKSSSLIEEVQSDDEAPPP